jgi:hypothetical protein
MASIDIIFVLDASGSMQPLISDTVGGFNAFIDNQRREPGDAYVTLATFDTAYRERFAAVPIAQLAPLTAEQYFGGHGGRTALLDAVGKAVTNYELLPVKADKTMFVIDTDGFENASVDWTSERVKALIERHQAAGWAFVFLGAGESQWQGRTLGTGAVGGYVASPAGMRAKYDKLAENTSAVRAAPGPAAEAAASRSWDTTEAAT